MRQGKANARSHTRAWVLLNLADGWDSVKIAETFAIAQATVKNVAHRYTEGGLDLVLHDRVQRRRRQALTGKPPAHLVAIPCSSAPDGHDRLPRAETFGQAQLVSTNLSRWKTLRSTPPSTANPIPRRNTQKPHAVEYGPYTRLSSWA